MLQHRLMGEGLLRTAANHRSRAVPLFGCDREGDGVTIERTHRILRRLHRLVAPHAEPKCVKCRHHEQGEHGRDQEAAHDGDGERSPEHAPRQRNHPEDGSGRRQHDRARAPYRRVHDRPVAALPGRDVMVDLIDQDDRVAHDHAGKRDQAEQSDEAERLVGEEEGGGRADQAERRRHDHQHEP